ncbi:uncharacterized protein LOC144103647 [Amblyomma americanum]
MPVVFKESQRIQHHCCLIHQQQASPMVNDISIAAGYKRPFSSGTAMWARQLCSHATQFDTKDKCRFGVNSVEFLGHRIDKKGVHTTGAKVKAIMDAPVPKTKVEL